MHLLNNIFIISILLDSLLTKLGGIPGKTTKDALSVPYILSTTNILCAHCDFLNYTFFFKGLLDSVFCFLLIRRCETLLPDVVPFVLCEIWLASPYFFIKCIFITFRSKCSLSTWLAFIVLCSARKAAFLNNKKQLS